jgi:hypothetical protein
MAMTDRVIRCQRCDDCRWICEAHLDKPWDGPTACGCGAPGDPCPDCNRAGPLDQPEMPPDFEVDRNEE